jgi:signal peptidase II
MALLISVLVLGLDQLSKTWALSSLKYAGATLILPGPVDLTLVFNRSSAFGMVPISGELTRWGLTVLNIIVVAGLTWAVLRRSMSGLTIIGMGFVIAGAAGNALDRIHSGAVLDFIDASKLGFIWVFNLADVSLDIGIALVATGMFLRGRRVR